MPGLLVPNITGATAHAVTTTAAPVHLHTANCQCHCYPFRRCLEAYEVLSPPVGCAWCMQEQLGICSTDNEQGPELFISNIWAGSGNVLSFLLRIPGMHEHLALVRQSSSCGGPHCDCGSSSVHWCKDVLWAQACKQHQQPPQSVYTWYMVLVCRCLMHTAPHVQSRTGLAFDSKTVTKASSLS